MKKVVGLFLIVASFSMVKASWAMCNMPMAGVESFQLFRLDCCHDGSCPLMKASAPQPPAEVTSAALAAVPVLPAALLTLSAPVMPVGRYAVAASFPPESPPPSMPLRI